MDVPECRPVIVASHPRSGTHLLMDVLRRQFPACSSWKWPLERLDRLYCNIDELHPGSDNLDEHTACRILRRTQRPLVKTHAWPGYEETFFGDQPHKLDSDWKRSLDQGTIFYIYRDGRDVLCSYQLFRQKFDRDAQGPIGDFLRGAEADQNRVRRWANHVRSWRSSPDAHPVQFERLIDSPEEVLQDVAQVLGLEPVWDEPLLPRPFSSIWESRWARLARMRPESTAIINGERQDWRECFTAEDRAFFHEQAGELLIELGYESSEDWVENAPT